MTEMDNDSVVQALTTFIEMYQTEIAPFAVDLVAQLEKSF